jgi:uncharacterized oxidoreductase
LRSQWLAKGAKVAISGRRREVVAKAVRPMQTGSVEIHGIASDVATAEGCAVTLVQTHATLGGLDVLVNNAGAVRVGRREKTDEAELQATINVTAAILLTRAAPPVLRNSGDAMIFPPVSPVGALFSRPMPR